MTNSAPAASSDRPRSALVRFMGCVRPHLRLVAGAALVGIGKFTLPLAFPLATKYVIDVLLAAHPRLDGLNLFIDRLCSGLAHFLHLSANSQGKLAALSLAMIGIYLLQAVVSYYRNYWGGIAGNRIINDLRNRLFSHLQLLPHSYFDRNSAGGIVSRVLNDVTQAQELVSSALIDVWMDAFCLTFVVWILWELDHRLALISLGVAPVYVLLMRYFSPRIKAVSHRLQSVAEDMSGEVHERVVGAAIVKSFVREQHEIDHFVSRSGQMYERAVDKARLAARQEAATQLLTRTAPMIVVWAAALLILQGRMSLGTLVAFLSLLGFLYMPLERFTQLSMVVSSSMAAMERIFEFLDLKPEIADHPLSRPFPIKRGAVDFDKVHFAYASRNGGPARDVLHEISLHIPAGTRVALVGRSGAGKTTLANLIPRFYDPSAGRVMIDGRDVRHFTLRSLRESISIVTQDTVLFSGSVRDNLLYARQDADDGALWRALEQAELADFVREMPEGLDTVIGGRGTRISGGQRQRLALARAFLKNSRILILDEATSAVDSESENLIHDAMERLMDGRTVFLIAHRFRSAVNADLILVLDQGSVVESGSHFELLRRAGLYARLYNEQTRGLTLAESAMRRPALI